MALKTTIIRTLALFALAAPLAACVTGEQQFPRKEILPKYTLETETMTHEVRFSLSSSALSQAEATRILQFMDTHDVRDGDTISIESVSAELDPLAARRNENLVTLFETEGVRTKAMRLPGTIGHRVRIAFNKVTPIASACNNWADEDRYGYGNLPLTNIGCATQSNLLNALADPRDLYQSRQPQNPRAERMILIENARVESGRRGPAPLRSSRFSAGDLQ